MHMSDSICNGRRWIHLCISFFPFFSLTCFCKYSEIPLISHTQNRSYNVSELFWSVLFMRLSSGVFVFTLMKRCDRFATMLISCVSLCVWWSWLRSSDWKDFYLWSFCLAAFFFFRHIKAALTFILHHWRRFWIRIFFDKTRGSLVLRFLKLSLVQYMYCISGTLSSSGDHCAP